MFNKQGIQIRIVQNNNKNVSNVKEKQRFEICDWVRIFFAVLNITIIIIIIINKYHKIPIHI